MLELLNVRITFLLRSTHANDEGHFPIVLRLIFRKERRDIFTGLYIDKTHWDAKAARLLKVNRRASSYNDNLDLIQRKAYSQFDELKFGGVPFTIDQLVDRIKGREEKPELLMDYLESEKKRLKKRLLVDISPATYDKYRRSATHVQSFILQEFKVKNYALNRINGDFLERYFQYLRGTRGIGHNTAVKYITFFKTIIMPALRSGALKHDPFKEIKLKQKPVFKGYLTQEDLDKLTSVTLSKDQDRIRDLFLFCCYTGLAYSDVKQLSRTHIQKDGEENYYIRKPRQKTGQESIIPLLPVARRILQKYSLTPDFRDFIWYVSTNQKMNKRLKEIGAKAGIDKELHMHLSRHTFATTVTLSNGIPIESVSAMLGHASLKQTQHYAKIISKKLHGDMSKISGLFQ